MTHPQTRPWQDAGLIFNHMGYTFDCRFARIQAKRPGTFPDDLPLASYSPPECATRNLDGMKAVRRLENLDPCKVNDKVKMARCKIRRQHLME